MTAATEPDPSHGNLPTVVPDRSRDPTRDPTRERRRRDQLTLSDRMVIHPHFHVIVGVATILSCQWGGVGLGWSLVTGSMMIFFALVGRNLMIQRHFRDGLYRRVLAISRRLEATANGQDEAATWNTLQAECHLMLGDLDQARAALDENDEGEISDRIRVSRRIDMAVLLCRTGESDRALQVIDEIDERAIPPHLVPNCILIRASALYWRSDFEGARSLLEEIDPDTLHPTLVAGSLGLRALIALEGEGNARKALKLSQRALDAMEDIAHARPGIIVDHAYILMEATGDSTACLEILEGLFGTEPELGPTGEAVLHYLLARCYADCGIFGEARCEIALAQERPASAHLAGKIRKLAAQLAHRPAL